MTLSSPNAVSQGKLGSCRKEIVLTARWVMDHSVIIGATSPLVVGVWTTLRGMASSLQVAEKLGKLYHLLTAVKGAADLLDLLDWIVQNRWPKGASQLLHITKRWMQRLSEGGIRPRKLPSRRKRETAQPVSAIYVHIIVFHHPETVRQLVVVEVEHSILRPGSGALNADWGCNSSREGACRNRSDRRES